MSLETKLDKQREDLRSLAAEQDALIAYANGVTGAGDTRLGDAIKTLADGYGQGGEPLETITINGTYSNGATIAEYLNGILPDLGYTRGVILKKAPISSSGYIAAIIPFQNGAVFGTPHRYRNSSGLSAAAYTSNYAYALNDGAEYIIFHL